MIIHNVDYKNELSETIEDSDFDTLRDQGIQEVWYHYKSGNWEGEGYIIVRNGDQYGIDSLGHCSCYGPLDRISFSYVEKSKLRDSLSTTFIGDADELLQILHL